MGSLADLARKLRPMIEDLAQALEDATALEYKELYAMWAEGVAYATGLKLRYKDKLYRVLQRHTSQTGWEPDVAASLFEVIDEEHAGTVDDPIPYSGNMALEAGKYYSQDGVKYLCIRDTGIPVYHALADLVGIYVEVVE